MDDERGRTEELAELRALIAKIAGAVATLAEIVSDLDARMAEWE